MRCSARAVTAGSGSGTSAGSLGDAAAGGAPPPPFSATASCSCMCERHGSLRQRSYSAIQHLMESNLRSPQLAQVHMNIQLLVGCMLPDIVSAVQKSCLLGLSHTHRCCCTRPAGMVHAAACGLVGSEGGACAGGLTEGIGARLAGGHCYRVARAGCRQRVLGRLLAQCAQFSSRCQHWHKPEAHIVRPCNSAYKPRA